MPLTVWKPAPCQGNGLHQHAGRTGVKQSRWSHEDIVHHATDNSGQARPCLASGRVVPACQLDRQVGLSGAPELHSEQLQRPY